MKYKVAMVVFSYYPADPRVRREAEALQDKGMQVDVICLKNVKQSEFEIVNGVNVYRLNISRSRGNKINYIIEYFTFIIFSLIKLTILHLKQKYKLIQVHNMPDILVFSGIIPKLSGAKVLLDLHDPMPEVFMAKYDINHKNILIRILLIFEKISILFSDYVITPNLSFRKLFIQRGCPENKIDIVMNSPQIEIFDRSKYICKSHLNSNQFTIMYHGTIVERHGLDTALLAIKKLKGQIPNIRFKVYGEGDFMPQFLKMRKKLGLTDIVDYFGHVPLEEVAEAITDIDVGVIPNKLSCFTSINLPTRIFEYLSMGKSVVAPRTQGIMDYFNEDDLNFFDQGNPDSLANVLFTIFQDEDLKNFRFVNGFQIFSEYEWEKQKQNYIGIVNTLIDI